MAFVFTVVVKVFPYQDSGVISTSVDNHLSNMSNTNGSSWFKFLVNVLFLTIFIIIIQNMDVLSHYSRALTTTSTSVNDMRLVQETHAQSATDEKLKSLSDKRAKENYFIVFVIPTHPRKVQQRNAIRKTWANVQGWSLLAELDKEKKRIRVLFICGNPPASDNTEEFKAEVSKNDDIFVVKNITEGKVSLRYKNMWGFRYSYQHYNFEYLVKTDDDVTVNLPKMIQDLSKYPRGFYYLGSNAGKVGKPPQQWRYCSGGGYVLSYDLVQEIVHLSPAVHKPTMKPEDVFTGWLVWNVNNNTEHSVLPHPMGALHLSPYKCGPLNKWFYHGYKKLSPESRIETFHDYFMNNTPSECS